MHQPLDHTPASGREKRAAALFSVLAAVFLTVLKIVVGIVSGSLGILAEALHSGLDLAAAAMTYLAVHFSDRPPDEEHPYGHGKIESFSALFETILLLVTCIWIIYAAVQRLFFKTVEVDPSVWAFLVMIVSVLVSYGQSRVLMHAARKHKSQALEADALHFSTDVWSSCVVVLGLILVKIGQWTGTGSVLIRADALAAMGVAVIVLWVSWKLIQSVVDVLLDRAPLGLADNVRRMALSVPGVVDCRRIRVRHVGPQYFVDMILDVPRILPLEQVHDLSSKVEADIEAAFPKVDVTIQVEPVAVKDEDWADRVQVVAGRLGYFVHDVRVSEETGRRVMHCHLEVKPELTLKEAHNLSDRFEADVMRELPDIVEVNTHIESKADGALPDEEVPQEIPHIEKALKIVLKDLDLVFGYHHLKVYRLDKRLVVALHCDMDGNLPVTEAHGISSRVSEALRKKIPAILRVQIHLEPKP